jgi:hypothetical protein
MARGNGKKILRVMSYDTLKKHCKHYYVHSHMHMCRNEHNRRKGYYVEDQETGEGFPYLICGERYCPVLLSCHRGRSIEKGMEENYARTKPCEKKEQNELHTKGDSNARTTGR